MGYLNRIEKAKKLLASIKKPENHLELKYGNVDAKQAWDLFFSLFIIRFKHLYRVTAEVKPIQWKTLSDVYNFLDDMVIKLAATVTEYNFLMKKYGSEEYLQQFKNHYEQISGRVFEIRTGAQACDLLPSLKGGLPSTTLKSVVLASDAPDGLSA